MSNPLNILREYTIDKRRIIEKDGNFIFGTYSWPKTVKTNYVSLIWNSKINKEPHEYYTLESLVFLTKHLDLPHPVYCRKAQAANVPVVKRPDRKRLLNYLTGVTNTSKSIDIQFPTVFPAKVKTEPAEETNEAIVDVYSSNLCPSSLPENDRNSCSEKPMKIETESEESTNEVEEERHSSVVLSSSSDNERGSTENAKRAVDDRFYDPESDVETLSSIEDSIWESSPLDWDGAIEAAENVPNLQCENCTDLKKKLSVLEADVNATKRALLELQTSMDYVYRVVLKLDRNKETEVAKPFKKMYTLRDLQHFDYSLSAIAEFNEKVKYFKMIGGNDKHSMTRHVLSNLISKNLASELNWSGENNKISIRKYNNVVQLIIVSVRCLYRNAKVREIESWIAKWLKCSAERCRRKRKHSER